MSEPLFLSVEQVSRLQRRLIERFGGIHGVRDPILLESAVIQPRNVFFYVQGDLFDVAAGYAFHIAQAQAFLDGNKRTGIAAAFSFLEWNGISIPAATEQYHYAMIAVAEGRMDTPNLAKLLREAAGSK